METQRVKPVTYDIKKEQRFQSKKRKLQSLLNLFQEEEKSSIADKKKKNGETVQEDLKVLKSELKKYMKKPEIDPCFHLTEKGSKSRLLLKTHRPPKNVIPLFFKDVYQLLLKSIIGHMSPHPITWAKLEQPQNVSRTVILIIEGLPKDILIQNRSSLPNMVDIFPHIVEVASPNVPFPQELCTLHQITHFHIETTNTYSTMFPSKKVVKVDTQDVLEKPSKLHLLLSPIQLVMENYPLPQSVFQFSKSENYTFSKDFYAPVTANSPMFALDCEMCRTATSNNELTRIALIDEKHEILYQTLVKPKVKIIDYMTKYSGITKEMLKGVQTKLSDVQAELRAILPPDAILCGQSLNCDLHALKMIHPYVIDTSIIFNGSGIRTKKDSLKYLSMVHLNEKIQNSKKGHNPVEDALATMKLVQLKLNNSLQFGDACLGENTIEDCEEKDVSNIKEASKEDEPAKEKVDDGFFALTSKHNKKICVIGSEETLNLYNPGVPEDVQKLVKSSTKKVLKTTINQMENFDLTIGHIDFNSSDASDLVKELDNTIKQVFDSCSHKSMFMVLTSGIDNSKFEDIRHGLFMATIKKIN